MPAPKLENPEVLTGCDVTIKMNGSPVGFGKNVDIEENVNQQPVEAIGYWKPRGFKSTRWDGTLSMEFHILTKRGTEGVIPIDTSSPTAASAGFFMEFNEKSTGKRVATAIGHINTRGFNISNNELSGQRCQFVLRDIDYKEGYN
ncbi:MAG TPA: hypothetical protein DEA96_09695 [Leptospiraceae bacterium]|nr:hypothetical protein [Leptospiraceae bacterium]|tara:strand:- start:23547 stop:23981 length:435 start_codon:yes stop_codon:yes gene_type:complete